MCKKKKKACGKVCSFATSFCDVFGFVVFSDSIATYTVLKLLVSEFLLERMCTHLLFHLQLQ